MINDIESNEEITIMQWRKWLIILYYDMIIIMNNNINEIMK